MDTSFRDDSLVPMHSILAMPVQGGQVLRAVVHAVVVPVMHFHLIPRPKKQSTGDAAASLPADAPGHPRLHPRVAAHASCPVAPVPVVRTLAPPDLDVSDNPGLLVLAQSRAFGGGKGPARDAPVFGDDPVPALARRLPVRRCAGRRPRSGFGVPRVLPCTAAGGYRAVCCGSRVTGSPPGQELHLHRLRVVRNRSSMVSATDPPGSPRQGPGFSSTSRSDCPVCIGATAAPDTVKPVGDGAGRTHSPRYRTVCHRRPRRGSGLGGLTRDALAAVCHRPRLPIRGIEHPGSAHWGNADKRRLLTAGRVRVPADIAVCHRRSLSTLGIGYPGPAAPAGADKRRLLTAVRIRFCGSLISPKAKERLHRLFRHLWRNLLPGLPCRQRAGAGRGARRAVGDVGHEHLREEARAGGEGGCELPDSLPCRAALLAEQVAEAGGFSRFCRSGLFAQDLALTGE
jgi:hypothetical protein